MKSFLTISAGSRLIRLRFLQPSCLRYVYSNSFGNSWNLRSVTGLGAELPRLFLPFYFCFYSNYYFVDFSLGFDYSNLLFLVCLGPSSFTR